MHEKVMEFYLEQKNKEKKLRQEKMMKNGLYDKVYDPKHTLCQNNSDIIYDPVDPLYAKVPIELTDEEYAKIEPYLTLSEEKENLPTVDEEINDEVKMICTILNIISAVICLGGMILGAVLFYYFTDTDINWQLMLSTWFISIISAASFYSLSTIVRLLSQIYQTLSSIRHKA